MQAGGQAAFGNILEADAGKTAKPPRNVPETPRQREIRRRLQSMICPIIDFENTSPDEAMAFFKLSRAEAESPAKSKLPLIIRPLREGESLPPGIVEEDIPLRGKQIDELRLKNVPMWDAIHIAARMAGLRVKLTDEGLEISPQ